MNAFMPSAQQLAAFDCWPRARPVALFYQYDRAAGCHAALAPLAENHGGHLRWAAAVEQNLIGKSEAGQHACLLRFGSREAARAFCTDAAHAAAFAGATKLLVSVISDQPAVIAAASALLARLMPLLPLDKAVSPGEEPGLGTSTNMPNHASMDAFMAHPEQATPVVMINWLKFRDTANYAAGTAPASGRTAYLRYGQVAVSTAHYLGAKLLFACRYQQILIGNGGDPAPQMWDEFALMQYPSRATFKHMASMRRYRNSLHHREAGLAEYGQALVISKPRAEFVWRR